MQQGDVWIVALPMSPGGREQAGERPAVVIQDEIYGQKSPLALIALLTSQLAALRFPGSVRIEPSVENGLRVPPVAMAFQARALDRTRFKRKIGALAEADLRAVLEELRKLTGL